VYPVFRKSVTDQELLTVGRVMTLVIGLATVGLCLWYVSGGSDLFTIMIEILALSAPVMNVPMLMGLLSRRAPRAAGLASIVWGVTTALVTKLALDWSFGPRIYFTEGACLAVFLIAPAFGRLWRTRRGPLAILGVAAATGAALFGLVLWITPGRFPGAMPIETAIAVVAYPAVMAALLVVFAWRFSLPENRDDLEPFFRDLDTPVNVATEVTGSANAALGVYRLVGGLTLLIAGLVLLLMALELARPPAGGAEPGKYALLTAILLFLAGLFYLSARRAATATRKAAHAPPDRV